MRIVIIDFEDSFTFNILAELKNIGFDAQIIAWTDFKEGIEFDLLILGPGPGHPHDYASLFPLLKEILKSNRKVLGICLGHQLIWNLQDALITRSKYPVHGEKTELILDEFWQRFFSLPKIIVQRYNSLAVLEHSIMSEAKLLCFDNEVMASYQDNIIGVQFHPESLGTHNRKKIFSAIMGHFFAS